MWVLHQFTDVGCLPIKFALSENFESVYGEGICLHSTKDVKMYKNAKSKSKALKKQNYYYFISGASVGMLNAQVSEEFFIFIIYMAMYRFHGTHFLRNKRNKTVVIFEHWTLNILHEMIYDDLMRRTVLSGDLLFCVCVTCERFSHSFPIFSQFIIFLCVFVFIFQFSWMHELHCSVRFGLVGCLYSMFIVIHHGFPHFNGRNCFNFGMICCSIENTFTIFMCEKWAKIREKKWKIYVCPSFKLRSALYMLGTGNAFVSPPRNYFHFLLSFKIRAISILL